MSFLEARKEKNGGASPPEALSISHRRTVTVQLPLGSDDGGVLEIARWRFALDAV